MTELRLGVYGGTFDPPHYGHLILAEEARMQLGLAQVIWLPVGRSPFKLNQENSPVETRMALVQVAIADNPDFVLSRIDADRPAPQYSVDTLKLVQDEYPAANLFWLMGEDSLHDLPNWKRSAEFVAACQVAVLKRPNTTLDVAAVETALPALIGRLHWVKAPQMEIAGQDIRQRVANGRSIRYFVPPAVAALIEKLGLYRSPTP